MAIPNQQLALPTAQLALKEQQNNRKGQPQAQGAKGVPPEHGQQHQPQGGVNHPRRRRMRRRAPLQAWQWDVWAP